LVVSAGLQLLEKSWKQNRFAFTVFEWFCQGHWRFVC